MSSFDVRYSTKKWANTHKIQFHAGNQAISLTEWILSAFPIIAELKVWWRTGRQVSCRLAHTMTLQSCHTVFTQHKFSQWKLWVRVLFCWYFKYFFSKKREKWPWWEFKLLANKDKVFSISGNWCQKQEIVLSLVKVLCVLLHKCRILWMIVKWFVLCYWARSEINCSQFCFPYSCEFDSYRSVISEGQKSMK